MKKFLSILVVLMLCVSVAVAESAETADTVQTNVNNDFNIIFEEPEGYASAQAGDAEHVMVFFTSEKDPDACGYILSVAHSELLDDVDFGAVVNEMSEEEQIALQELVAEDFADPTFTVTETAMGTKLLLVNENGGESDYAVLITYYKSYIIELDLLKQAEITDAEIQAAIDILSSMEFVEQ